MNDVSTQAPTVEVAPARPSTEDRSSTAILAGPAFLVGGYVSTTPGVVAALQYRTSDAHAFVIGGRGGVHFPGKYTGVSVFGTLGVELGYRGNFVPRGSIEGGFLATVIPSVAFGVGGETAFIAPVNIGGFARFGAFELQLTAGGGPAVGMRGPSGMGLFALTGGAVF